MSSIFGVIIQRGISTTSICHGKKSFRKFDLPNKRGTRLFKEAQRIKPHPSCPIDRRGTRDTGYKDGERFITVQEMIPEIIVPDLKDFKLKAYVSYRSTEVVQSEFQPIDLFNAIYSGKIREDFRNGKLDENGQPLEPSVNEKLTIQEAKDNAGKTGCDLFTETIVDNRSKKSKDTVYTAKYRSRI